MPDEALDHNELRRLIVLDRETGQFFWRSGAKGRKLAKEPLGFKNDEGYIIITLNGARYPAHRLVWFYEFGEFPDYPLTHKNKVRSDNRTRNLRQIIPDLKRSERQKRSPYQGVTWDRNREAWVAKVQRNGVRHYLGRFKTEEEARNACIAARQRWEKEKTTPVGGVTWDRRRKIWRARTTVSGRRVHIGWFETKEAALEAVKGFSLCNGSLSSP